MSEPVETKKTRTVSGRVLLAEVLRDEAAAARGIAQSLYAAEMAADWKAVAAVRAELVRTSLELEAEAEREHPRG